MVRQPKPTHPLEEIFAPAELWKQRFDKPYPDLQIGPAFLSGDSVDLITQEVKSRHPEWLTDPETVLVVVRSELSAIEKTFKTWEKQVGPLLERTARILGAWLCETAEQLTHDQFLELYHESSELWRLINSGTPGEGGADQISYFENLCDKYATPPEFVERQWVNLHQHFRVIDRLKSDILLVNDRRVAYEVLQNELITQSPKQPGGKKLSVILSSSPDLLKYARCLKEEQDMTLPEVWKRITDEAENLVTLPYSSFESFKRSYYNPPSSRERSEDSSLPE